MLRNLSWEPRRLFVEQDAAGGAGGGGVATPTAAPNPGTPTPAPAASPAAPNPPPGVTAEQWQGITGPLLQTLGETIDNRLQPVRDAQNQLQGRLDQMAQPQNPNAGGVFARGGGGGYIPGELPSAAESRGYQFYRVAALKHNSPYYTAENCKYEMDVHQRLYKAYVEQGGMMLGGDNSMLVPMGANMIMDDLADLRAELSVTIAQGIRGADSGELLHSMRRAGYAQALSMFDDTALGVFAHGGPQGEMIDLLRNREVFSRVGATNVTLPPNGRLPYPRHTGAGTAYWVGENQAITASEQSTGSLTLIAKKLAALVKLPNELVRFGNPSVEAFIRNDLTRVMALEADLAMLEGIGSTTKVKGLINYDDINAYTASTVATDGNTLEPQDGLLAVDTVEQANHDSTGFKWVMRSKMWTNILNRRAAAHTASTYDGPWLFRTNRDDISRGMPMMWDGHEVVKSNQVSNTRVKGSGTDLTYLLGGLFEHYLIGRVGVMEFANTTSGDTAFANDQTWLRVIQHIDAAPRYENAFVLIDDIDMDLPA